MSQLEVSTQWHQQWVGTVCYSKGKPWMLSTSAPSPQSPGCSQAVCQEQTFRRDSQQNATLRSIFESIEIDWVHQQSLFYIVLLQMNSLGATYSASAELTGFFWASGPRCCFGKDKSFFLYWSCLETNQHEGMKWRRSTIHCANSEFCTTLQNWMCIL